MSNREEELGLIRNAVGTINSYHSCSNNREYLEAVQRSLIECCHYGVVGMHSVDNVLDEIERLLNATQLAPAEALWFHLELLMSEFNARSQKVRSEMLTGQSEHVVT